MTKPIRLRTTLSATTILAAGLMLAAMPASAQNLPDTGNVTSVTSGLSGGAPGSTNPAFTTSGAPGAQTLQVDLKDNRTILNWGGSGFDIAAGNTVDFKDARAASGVTGRTDNIAVLNRVQAAGGISTTRIDGAIRSDANVAVYLINQGGIMFGATASVDTGSFFASTSNLTNDNDFLNGSTSLRFGQYITDYSSGVRPTVSSNPGARFKTTASASSNGGRMGDLVFVGGNVVHNDNVISTIGGDAAFIAATDVTIASAPGSPLSFTIHRGTDVYNLGTIRVGGSVNARNITIAAVNSTAPGIGGTALITLDGSLTATGAAVGDRGVVLTAGGTSSNGVAVAAGNHSEGSLAFSAASAITSSKNIYLNRSGLFADSGLLATLSAAGLLDVTGGIGFGPSSGTTPAGSITAGSIAIHGGASFFSRPVTTTQGDFTFDGGAIFIGNSNFDIAGNLIGTGTTFGQTSGTIRVGGQISVVTSGDQDWWQSVTASGPIFLQTTGLSGTIEAINLIKSINGDVTLRAAAGISAATIESAGKVDVESGGRVSVGTATGGLGVRLVANRRPVGGFDEGRLVFGAINATGATADVTLSGYSIQKNNDLSDGGTIPISVSAGRDIFITQTRVQRSLLLGNVTAGRNASVTATSISATKIEATTGSVTAITTPPIIAGDGTISIGEIRAGTNGLVDGSSVIVSNATAGGNLSFRTTASSLSLGLPNAVSSINAGGDISLSSAASAVVRGSMIAGGSIDVTGTSVALGSPGGPGAQIKAAGAASFTATATGIQGLGNVLVQSNSDGAGNEALTLSAGTSVSFAPAGTLLGGTDRQSDIQIRSAANGSVTLTNLSARSLLSATGSDPFTNGIVRNAAIGFLGQVSLINSLSVQGTNVGILGPITVTAGNIDLRSASPISVNAALNASGDISVVTSTGNFTVGANGSFTGRDILLSTPGAFINNRGANAMSASGRWLVYSANPDGNTFGGLDSGHTAIWNGTLATRAPSTITGSRYVFAQQPTLTFSTVDFSKIYGTDLNGSTAIPFAVSGYHPGVAGAFLGDTAATAFTGNPLIQSAGFAERATVAGGPYAQTIAQGSLQSGSGYAFAFAPSTGLVTVTPKALTGTIAADNKIYDGNTNGTGTVTLNGVVSGDTVGSTGSVFTFADKNAGTGKTVNVTGTTLNGADSGNYTLTVPASALADILKKVLTAVVTANGKTYDGTTATTGSLTLDGVIAGETVGSTGSVFTFADKNAGTGKTVNVTGTTLTGADSDNYTLTLPVTALADILKKALTANVTANGKTYDGTTAATGLVALNGVVSGDDIGTNGSVFTFADKNAGTGKTVNVTGTTLNGADSGNYTLTVPASALADILKKALTATVSADGKTYDSTTATTGSVTLSGVVAGDTVGTTGSVFTFVDKNAGTGKTVNVTGTTLNGADSGNYTLTVPASALADILKKALTAAVSANGKTYDGTTATTGSVSLSGVVAGDTVGTTGSVFTFADKNAGTAKTVNVTDTTLTGTDSGNYTLTVPVPALADILKKALTATVSANGKAYDGTTTATGSVVLNGVVSGDAVSTGAITFTFADKNAGTGKSVAVGGGLSGADGGNYTVTLPATLLADILKKSLTATITANGKVYDGTTAGTGTVTLNGVVAGDSVGTGGTGFTFADKNAGTGKTVNVTGTTLTGTDSGNYTLTVPATVLADIAKRALSVRADDKEKYTGDDDPALTYLITLGSLVSGDQLTGALARAIGEAPGDYAIGQGSLSAGGNYALTFTPGTFTITVNPATNQPQTLRAVPLPSSIQTPPSSTGSGVSIDANALCGEDTSCAGS